MSNNLPGAVPVIRRLADIARSAEHMLRYERLDEKELFRIQNELNLLERDIEYMANQITIDLLMQDKNDRLRERRIRPFRKPA